MQSTNSEYGLPYLSTCHVTFTFFTFTLNASIFTRIIRDPASSTEISIRVFYESLQIAFPNNVLVSQFRG